jgi:urease accessory protein
MNDDEETYILLLLADSNLPTGSFVASSGLESYIKHGFPSSSQPATLTFLRGSLSSYARTSLPFVSDAHHLVSNLATEGSALSSTPSDSETVRNTLQKLTDLDNLYEALTLNHVARRASKAQGVALLTLYSKGFTTPASLSAYSDPDTRDRERRMGKLLDTFKLSIRREEVNGHLPVCWGALTAALGLTLGNKFGFTRKEAQY